MTEEMREKISLFCNVRKSAVIEERDVNFSVYEVPVNLVEHGLCRHLASSLGLPNEEPPALDDWKKMLSVLQFPERTLEIAVVGKYMQLHDAYKSVYESLTHGGIAAHAKIELRKIDAERVTEGNVSELLKGVDGVVIPGGFGERGIEGKIQAARWARETQTPLLALCLGLQCITIEFARNVAGLEGANSSEFDPATPDPVIHLIDEQHDVTDQRWHDAPGCVPLHTGSGDDGQQGLWRVADQRAPPAPLRVQQQLPRQVPPDGPHCVRDPRAEGSGRDRGDRGSPVLRRRSVFIPSSRASRSQPHPLFRDFIATACRLKTEAVEEKGARV